MKQLRDLQAQVRRVVADARRATVAIEQDDSIGSGVIINPEGLILTAGHVCVEPNREVWIRFPDDSRVRGRTLGVNHPLDSGMAQISEPAPTEEGWPCLQLAEEQATPGDWVVALGQPNGFVEDRAPPVRLGRVLVCDEEAINSDAALVGGDSGGPLLNLRGEVVAVHSRIGERLTSNYHVPVVAFRNEWRRLLRGRMTGAPDGEDPDDSRAHAGMAIRLIGDRCVVTQVFPGGAADTAGVRPGDVIVRLAGLASTDPSALARHMAYQEAYDRVPLVLRRDDAAESIELELWLGRTARDFPGADPADTALRGGSTS